MEKHNYKIPQFFLSNKMRITNACSLVNDTFQCSCNYISAYNLQYIYIAFTFKDVLQIFIRFMIYSESVSISELKILKYVKHPF